MANLSCNVTPIQLFSNHEISQLKWIKSSSQQDTLIAQQKDGLLSVLKIKDGGAVSRFVLDPNVVCAFWDDDDFKLSCHRLFAQAQNGNIVIYTVNSDGVIEAMHILASKLISFIDPASYGVYQDASISLVACEQSHIVLTMDSKIIATVLITSTGSLLEGCVLPLSHYKAPESVGTVKQDFDLFQAVNGILCLFDPNKTVVSMHSISSGECFCKIDFSPLSLQVGDLLLWKMSYDRSSIMIIKKDLHVHRIVISKFAEENPQAVITIDKTGREKSLYHEYLTYHLCRFGDASWKKEITEYHMMATQGMLKKNIKSNVTGFKISRKKNSKSRSDTALANTPCCFIDLDILKEDEWTISACEATSDVLTLLMFRKGINVEERALLFANFKKNYFYLHRLEASCVILSTRPSSFHLIWTDRYIKYIATDPDMKKDDLISWMMMYSGPQVADNLCQGNQWTRTAIPLTALEASLQQRQLDTLGFFFKSKQGLFTNVKQSRRLSCLAGEIQQIEAALQLVSGVVAIGVKESQARLFSQRLLSITLDFLYSLLDDAKDCLPKSRSVEKQVVLDREIQESYEKLQRHVSSLRNFMQQFKYRGSSYQYNNKESHKPEVDITVDEADAKSNISVEQSIKDNALTKHLSTTREKKAYSKVLNEVLRTVQKHMQNKDISSCTRILANLGCDVNQALWMLSQFYSDRSLQDFITSHLLGAGLTETQHKIVQLMIQLYKAYPNKSFRDAYCAKHMDPSNSPVASNDPLEKILPTVDNHLPSYFTDFQDGTGMKEEGSSSHLYASVLLAWLSQWLEELKHSVFIDAKFLSAASTSDHLSIMREDPQETWKFLISHNLTDIVQTLFKEAESDKKFPWPADLLSSLQMGSSYLQKEILRHLLKIGKLSVSSAKAHDVDIQALLPLLGGPMKHPHVLSYAGPSAMMKFHQDFIANCVAQGLQLPLWIYCTIHGIDLRKLSVDHKTSWFSSFQLALAIPKYPKERSLLVAASKMAAGDLWCSPPTPMSIEAMLSQGHAMEAMATLSYMSQCDEVLKPELLQNCLHRFPKLVLALMPEESSSSNPFTTVYELLMGNVPFNLRRLFGWHATNPYAGEDSATVMPHFSELSLTALYPCRRKLAFPFYLNQGRPVYAFHSFMSEELDRREAPVSEKRVHQACGVALWQACQNFNTSHITSACVIFAEWLGQDSALIRCMIHAGRLMLASRGRHLTDDLKIKSQEDIKKVQEERQKILSGISTELQACVKSQRRHGPNFLSALQVVVTELIIAEGLNRTSNEASQKWLLVIMLCRLLHLPLSTTFLEECAKADNWFMFLWFAQLHQYPTHQLLSLLHNFQSHCYRDHLHYVICNAENKMFSPPPQLSSSGGSSFNSFSSRGASGEPRTFLYQRIGVTKDTAPVSSDEDDYDGKSRESGTFMSSFSSRIRHAEFHESEIPESTAPDDVFRLLFYSQSMPCQWRCLLAACVSLRNPLFAELAASCGCPALPSICGWLLASLDNLTKEQFLSQYGQTVSKWKLEQLEALIEVILNCGCEDALATAFTIFQPASPLTSFFSFVHECLRKGQYSSTKTFLNQFKDAMASFELNTGKNSTSEKEKTSELRTVGDRSWMERVVYQVLCYYLKHVKSLYEAYHLLDILDTNNIALVFSFDVINFSLLNQVVEIIHDNEIPNIDLISLLMSGTTSSIFGLQCEAAIDFLTQERKFQQARALSDITKINKEKVALGQLKGEKQKLLRCQVWTAKNVRIQYWEKAYKLLAEMKCSLEACDNFFTEELKETSVESEKALLCQHLLLLLDQSEDNNPEGPDLDMKRESVFRSMWKYRIASQMSIVDQEPLDRIFTDELVKTKKEEYLKSDIAETSVDSKTHSDSQEDLTAKEIEVLDSLIGSYLDKGKVKACSKVAAVFGHYNQDLTIIQTCISLASGECSLDRIEPAMKRLVTKTTPQANPWTKRKSFSRSRTLSSSSFDTVSMSGEIEFLSKNHETNTLMEKLYGQCVVRGRQVCLRIVTCYKIAEVIDTTYQDIVFGVEFDILQRVLKTDNGERFSLARDFLTTSGLTDDEVSMFLADSIIDLLKQVVGSEGLTDEVQMGKQRQTLDLPEALEIISHYMMLSENTSLLGDRILQSVASFLSDDDGELSRKVLTLQTEMIIIAHECYTSASNMEGISHVLRAARVCSNCQAQAGEFNLMIRLLLGVGRYSEMLYIFHTLQQNHQFELILRKGMDREDKLKVAILDYLKRYQPDDSEAYTMVALKFTMFRDIAAMLEKCGHKALKALKYKRPLDNTKENQDILKKCLQYFKDAAESYVKDASVRKAQRCVRLARLVSLQLQLLSSGTIIVHLSSDEVITFINTHTRFIEAMIVSEAYERRANWAEAVYNNVVVSGDKSYLQEMQLHVKLTATLIEDVVNRHKTAAKGGGTLAGIRKLLSLCKDTKLQYKLANDLGLTDIVTSLLKSDAGSFLQDVSAL